MKPPVSHLLPLPKKLLAAASKDTGRDSINHAYVDAGNRAVVVCNGRILVTIPIPGKHEIKGGYIGEKLWKMARVANAKAFTLDTAAGTLNGLPLIPADEMNYPNWPAIMPAFDVAYRFSANPHYFAMIADSMGYEASDTKAVHFEFDATGEKPVRATFGGITAIIMPMRGDTSGIAKTAAKPEHSDAKAAAADAKVIEALTAELHQSRARVKQLEAHAMLHNGRRGTLPPAMAGHGEAKPAVKPLDAPGKATPPDSKSKAEVKPATSPPDLTRNEARDGIELRFNGKPGDEIRQQFKDRKWKWAPGQPGQPWYAKYSEENWLFANSLAYGTAFTPMPELPENIVDMPTPDAPATPSRVRKIQVPEF